MFHPPEQTSHQSISTKESKMRLQQLEIPGAKQKKWGEHEIEWLSSHFCTGSGRNTHHTRMHFISTNGIWPQMQQSPFQLKTSALEESEKMAFQDLQMNVVSLKNLNERHTTKLSPENPEQLSKCSLAELEICATWCNNQQREWSNASRREKERNGVSKTPTSSMRL